MLLGIRIFFHSILITWKMSLELLYTNLQIPQIVLITI